MLLWLGREDQDRVLPDVTHWQWLGHCLTSPSLVTCGIQHGLLKLMDIN